MRRFLSYGVRGFSSTSTTSPLRVAICGGGTVGGGVVEILESRQKEVKSLKRPIVIRKLLVRDAKKTRDFEVPSTCEVVTNVDDVLKDDDVDVVVELIGGADGPAYDLTFGALRADKHVVSANKALIAAHMGDLVDTLSTSKGDFGFEAAVCGGIPIIHALQRDFLSDRVRRMAGIFNGTTNFILSSMELEKVRPASHIPHRLISRRTQEQFTRRSRTARIR